MQFIKNRFNYLFNSTKGLILVAIAMIGVVTAVWGMLSGPMAELGVREIVVKALGMKMVQAEREGRIIILYHSIAMAIVAIETYMINGLLRIKPFFKTAINAIITVGYITTMIFGMGFAYFGHNWAFHGLYIFGLSLIFFAGVLLCIALWPWNPEYYVTDKAYAHTKSGLDLERTAFFATAVTTVISALFGAVPGSFFGNGFDVFLAENIIRLPEKTTMEYSVIGHLHIMLALICVMITLIVGRWLNFKGNWHKVAMPLMILGTIVLNLGVWGVVTPLEPIAHMIIYVGATPSMLAALKEELDRGKVVSPIGVPKGLVTMHSKVQIRDLDDDETETYDLVYPDEADIDRGKLSVLTPVGTALLGARVGQVIRFAVPRGTRRLKVEKILYQPEASGDLHL